MKVLEIGIGNSPEHYDLNTSEYHEHLIAIAPVPLRTCSPTQRAHYPERVSFGFTVRQAKSRVLSPSVNYERFGFIVEIDGLEIVSLRSGRH